MATDQMGNGESTVLENAPDWNVLTDPWIEALDPRGNLHQASPLEALERAAEYHCIVAGSPLDLFAAHRFLLTLLYWKADAVGGVEPLREALLTGHVPEPVIETLKADAGDFRLFDRKSPFLQDPALAKGAVKADGTLKAGKSKSAGSFFAELATGSNIAHFQHGDDAETKLCLHCLTLGMIRVVPWSQSGGAGLTPSVHGAPPICALASGSTLAETLGLNLLPFSGELGQPQWTGHFAPSHPENVRPLEAFTWNPRRILLQPPSETGTCWHCGKTQTPVVGPVLYAKNSETVQLKKGSKTIPFSWEDPAVFYDAQEQYKSKKSSREERAADDRDLNALHDPETPPRCALCEKIPGHQKWVLVLPCTNPANNKSFDHRRIVLPNHPSEAIPALIPEKPPWQPDQKPVNGWQAPEGTPRRNGCWAFVRAAAQQLSAGDWATVSMAAFRKMHEVPPAFDLFCGLWWPVRKDHHPPERDIAWLVLKLMAKVPDKYRKQIPNASFDPLNRIAKRQIKGKQKYANPYPVAFPRGDRLEADLTEAIEANLRSRSPRFVDWVGLCDRLHSMTG